MPTLLFGVGVSCRILYCLVSCLLFKCLQALADKSPQWGEAVSAIDYSLYCCFCSNEFPLPLGAWERLCYFIMALSGPSIELFSI